MRPGVTPHYAVQVPEIEMEAGVRTVRIPTTTSETDVTFTLRRSGDRLEVKREGPAKPWKLLLVGVRSVGKVEGGTAEITPAGVMVTPQEAGGGLKVDLGDSA